MSRQEIANTLRYGNYYNPATRHYGGRYTSVTCDNCGKRNLDTCIGLDNCDLCMSCVDNLKRNSYEPIPTLGVTNIPVIMNPFIVGTNMGYLGSYGSPVATAVPRSTVKISMTYHF